jgi:hypothetical protein
VRQIFDDGPGPKQANAAASALLPKAFADFQACLDRALAATPDERYESARMMADDFAAVFERAGPDVVDQSALDRAETADVPYVKYQQHAPIQASGRTHLYVHRPPSGGHLVVKLWPGVRRGDGAATDLAMVRLFDLAARIIAAPVPSLPCVVDFGLSQIGPFVAYRHEAGTTLADTGPTDGLTAIETAQRVIHAVDALHAMDFYHGDVAPKNLLVGEDGAVKLLDVFDLSQVGDGRVRTPDYCPEGWERLSEQQIDRYAALKICLSILSGPSDERLAHATDVLREELGRPAVETFEPAIVALAASSASLRAPPSPRFVLSGPTLASGRLLSDDGTYFARVERPSRGRLQYSVAGVDRALLSSSSTVVYRGTGFTR